MPLSLRLASTALQPSLPDPPSICEGPRSSGGQHSTVKRIVVLGRGASGKSVFSRALGDATGLPCIELDKVFWSSDLTPASLDDWRELQADLVAGDAWILDGDLGPT